MHRVALAVGVLSLVLAGCGGNDAQTGGGKTEAPEALAKVEAGAGDFETQALVEKVYNEVDFCLTENWSQYEHCASTGVDRDIPLGQDPGEVVVDPANFGYTVTATSASGTVFTKAIDSDEIERTCAPDSPGCDDGAWIESDEAEDAHEDADLRSPDAAVGRADTAKRNARSAQTAAETCFIDLQTYDGCDLRTYEPDLPLGPGAGEVEIVETTASSYRVVSRDDAGGTYEITRSGDGAFVRTCSATEGCVNGSW